MLRRLGERKTDCWCRRGAEKRENAGMLEPLRNPVNWDKLRKVAALVLILSAAASVLFGIIYFFILGGRSPAPGNIFRALILLVPFIASGFHPTGSSSRTRRRRR